MDTIEHREMDIHTWFGLSYSNYLVLHRSLLQSMPEEWQHRFVRMLGELSEAFAHVEQADCYEVIPGVEVAIEELTDAQMTHLGISRPDGADGAEEESGEASEPDYYYLKDGTEMEGWMRVVWPKPDPVPHYNRGRTRIEPA